MRILLIAGGWSNEREVALSGAAQIEKALLALSHEVVRFDPRDAFDSLFDISRTCDFAFINLHGQPGEDGLLQAILDRSGCPYQGPGPAGSFLALHKASAKQIFRHHGLRTPDWVFLSTPPAPGWQCPLPFPVFAKSNVGGSSLEMGRAEKQEALDAVLSGLFEKGREVLVETSISGIELTCAVLGDEALPPILIKPLKNETFFDYESKYAQGGADEICPAPVDQAVTDELKRLSLAAHGALGLRGCSRADFILSDGALYLLEVNTLPGMTPTSLLPRSAAVHGLDFEALIQRLIDLGMEQT